MKDIPESLRDKGDNYDIEVFLSVGRSESSRITPPTVQLNWIRVTY